MIKKDIYQGKLKDQLKASKKDRLYRFMMADGTIRGAMVHGTRMVREMQSNHDLGIIETLILGQAYIAAALLVATLKSKDRLRLQIQCSGPLQALSVESNVYGEVRGYLKNKTLSKGYTGEETGLSSFFGAGFLTVTKYLTQESKPYSGQVMLEYGSLAKDLANYYLKSEQTPTAFVLSVQLDSTGIVAGAGGLFLQAMPGSDPSQVAEAETLVESLQSLGKEFSEGGDPESIILGTFKKLSPIIRDDQRIEFFCRCTREIMAGHLASLPEPDIKEIIAKGPFPLEICCHNCNSMYRFNKDDLKKLKR